MSLPVSDLTVTASSEYDRATRILSQSWRSEESTYRSPKMQSVNLGMSEDYTLSTEKARVLERCGSLKDVVFNFLKELGAPVLGVAVSYGEGVGPYMLVTLDCNARQALEYWLKVVDVVSAHHIPVFITWLGSVDVKPEEMGAYLGKILARMNVFLVTKEPLNITKILKEEWGT